MVTFKDGARERLLRIWARPWTFAAAIIFLGIGQEIILHDGQQITTALGFFEDDKLSNWLITEGGAMVPLTEDHKPEVLESEFPRSEIVEVNKPGAAVKIDRTYGALSAAVGTVFLAYVLKRPRKTAT